MEDKPNNNQAKSNNPAKRKQILDAALTLFLEKGFSGATTREIAKQAGIAEGTIYRYFNSKKDILLALVGGDIVSSLADTIQKVSGEKDEIIFREILKNRLKLVNKNIDIVKLILTEGQFHPEVREQFVENSVMKAASIFEQLIQQRIKDGEFRAIDPTISTRAFMGMIGVFVLWKEILFADKFIAFEDEVVIENIVDIFLNGIRKR